MGHSYTAACTLMLQLPAFAEPECKLAAAVAHQNACMYLGRYHMQLNKGVAERGSASHWVTIPWHAVAECTHFTESWNHLKTFWNEEEVREGSDFFFLIGKYSYGSPLKVFFLNVAQLRHPTNQITYYYHFTYKIFKNLKAIFFNTLAVFSSENWIFCVARQDFHQKCRCVCSYKIMETAYRQESLVMVMLQLHNTVFVFQKLLDSVQNLARATPSV